MKGDLTWSGKHTIQYIDNVLGNRMPESCVLLLTNVTPINSNFKKSKKKYLVFNVAKFKANFVAGKKCHKLSKIFN